MATETWLKTGLLLLLWLVVTVAAGSGAAPSHQAEEAPGHVVPPVLFESSFRKPVDAPRSLIHSTSVWVSLGEAQGG